jgi:putative beta-lysine N-acetyltransferase
MQRRNTFDTVEQVNGAVLKHGETHNRVYLIETEQNNWDSLIFRMKDLAHKKNYDKILGRVPEEAKKAFQLKGYQIEAKIPRMYNGEKTGYFLADYLNEKRSTCDEKESKTIATVKSIALAANRFPEESQFDLPSNLNVRQLDQSDFLELVLLHDKAFKSYSCPINKEEYLTEMAEKMNYEFYGLFDEKELLVSAILKINEKESNVEIVDFATHPDYRGQNLSYYLVQEIKKTFGESGYKTIYSLVRATSYGLNITFSKHGFSLGGTLLNNTVIHNNLESVNVWYWN